MKSPSPNSRVMRACSVVLLAVSYGCESREMATNSYYDERIAPILAVGCQRQTTGCHVDDGRGFALGNLDLGSYDSLMRRSDTLPAYGPYPTSLLLLKAGNAAQIDVSTIDPPDPSAPEKRHVSITTDIRHAAGEGAISQGSPNYSTLKRWIDSGYRRSGVPFSDVRKNEGPCSHTPQSRPYIDIDSAPKAPNSYARFVHDVAPVLRERCAGSLCHGVPLADLYLMCGDGEDELRWNYEIALRYLDEVAVSSELLRRPLATNAGGVYHEGGDIFANIDDAGYRAILNWVNATVDANPELLEFGEADAGMRFFANRVQPVLVRKGCMFLNCHSPSMFHDLRLRGGSQGFFSPIATRRNYGIARHLLAVDSPDPSQGRLIAKNLCPASTGGVGIQHRGGALFEDFGGCARADTRAIASKCANVDADSGDLNAVPGYCVIARWHAIERELAQQRGTLGTDPDVRGVVFVVRPPGVGGIADFDSYRPGADLLWADASVDAQGGLELAGTRSLLGGCGLAGSALDVRGPAVSWDAKMIAFAARSSASEPLRIYQMHIDGSACAPLTALASPSAVQDSVPLHDFDPAYAPDGRIVFASTRGNIAGGSSVRGPSRTAASLASNANLYVYTGSEGVRQLTFLSNQELAPSFMEDGRVIFTSEKRGLDFHQFAARRQNIDGGDYHPLMAQRSSIGFESATEVIELPNKNFALVAADLDAADGGGSIMVVNRSIGPDQADRDPGDRAFIHSLFAPEPGAFGGNAGVFRSPAALPSGRILASCDLSATNPAAGPHHYGLCELDPSGSTPPRMLFRDGSRVAVEAAAVWQREAHLAYSSRADETNGSTHVDPSAEDAVVHVTDMPMLATLLFNNTRVGRSIPAAMRGLEVFESRAAPSSAHSFADVSGKVVTDKFGQFYQDLRSLGKAPLAPDGSLRVRLPGGMPISLGLLDASNKTLEFGAGDPFTGPMRQREEMQFYPGERAKTSLPRRLFNGVCGGCHGSVSGRELDVVVDIDVLSHASATLADDDPIDLR